MKRLTEHDEFENADIIGVDSGDLQLNLEFDEFNKVTDALNRLAAYEDTGLTPKEVARLKAERDKAIEDITALLKCQGMDACDYCKADCGHINGRRPACDDVAEWRGLEGANDTKTD